MTDEEYREYLRAVGEKFLMPAKVEGEPHWNDEDFLDLRDSIYYLSSIARFVRVVDERPNNAGLLEVLGRELEDGSRRVESVVDRMRTAGVLASLDENPEITFGELRRGAIPEEDRLLLAKTGIEAPDVEITIIIQYCRKHLGQGQTLPSSVAEQARHELERATERVIGISREKDSPDRSRHHGGDVKKRKLFNGIGKILAGTVTAAGNLMLALGTIIAPNPATVYGVIGSSALAIGSISQGIGDLRGE